MKMRAIEIGSGPPPCRGRFDFSSSCCRRVGCVLIPAEPNVTHPLARPLPLRHHPSLLARS
jgi:hypothetical protein